MDVLVMLEDGPDESPVLARVDSVPAMVSTDHRAREVVTLYGTPSLSASAMVTSIIPAFRAASIGLSCQIVSISETFVEK